MARRVPHPSPKIDVNLEPNSYEYLNASGYGTHGLCIAVPSHFHFTKTNELPLAGMRIAVKDLFHIQGLHTGCGNRAYRRLYAESTITSAVVQMAIDKGAIIVGKTKTAEFGGRARHRAARRSWYSTAVMPGVSSPGASRCGCVSCMGWPNNI